MMRATHYGLLAHRDLARAALAHVPLGEGALRFRERMIELMRLGGLPDRVVAYGCELLSLYAVATAVEQALRDDDYSKAVGEYLAALPADRFPNIVALAGAGGGERFEFGLDVLVSGLAAYGPGRTSTAAG